MPGANHILDKTWRLNAAVGALRAVKYVTTDADAAAPASVLGEEVIGIVQEAVIAADLTTGNTLRAVRVIGPSRCVAGAAMNPGTRVRAAADGSLVALAAATANQNQVGIMQSKPTAAGDLAIVWLTPGVRVTTV